MKKYKIKKIYMVTPSDCDKAYHYKINADNTFEISNDKVGRPIKRRLFHLAVQGELIK